MSKKKTTLETLAQMVARGFERVDDRFEQIGERFEKVDDKFKQVDEKFKKMNERLDEIDLHISSLGSDWKERFDALEMRVRRLEQKTR